MTNLAPHKSFLVHPFTPFTTGPWTVSPSGDVATLLFLRAQIGGGGDTQQPYLLRVSAGSPSQWLAVNGRSRPLPLMAEASLSPPNDSEGAALKPAERLRRQRDKSL